MTSEARSPRAPSIRDVARVAGVSHQTVSRVLNNSAAIRDETRDRVLAAMAELQYRPNRAARALGSSRSSTIGVLTASRAQYGPERAVHGIEEAARARGYFVTTASITRTDTATIREALARLVSQDVEGLVVLAPQQRVFETIAELELDLPCVTLFSTSEDSLSTAAGDELAGARRATRHLLDLGHTSIRHLAGPRDWIEAEARMQGFLLELSARDMPVNVPVLGDWTADFGYRAGLQLLRWKDATAYFCANDAMALGLLHAARDLGVDVPGDVSIIGYDDVPEAAHLWPPLTTIRRDFGALGARCIGLLLGEDPAGPRPGIGAGELVVRASTGPVRA